MSTDRGVLSTQLYSDGRLHDLLYVDGGPSTTQTTGILRMQGQEVFRHAVVNIGGDRRLGARRRALPVADIDWIVPHQANQRILDGTARKLGICRRARDFDHRRARQHLGRLGAAGAGRRRSADGRIKRGDLCCWKPWAAASPGARRWSAGSRPPVLNSSALSL